MILLMSFFMMVTATMLHHLGHDWVDAFYVTVQSYTTIGFGDIDSKRNGGHIIIFFLLWDSLGMTILAALINSFVQIETKDLSIGWKRMRNVIKKQRSASYEVHQKPDRGQQNQVAEVF